MNLKQLEEEKGKKMYILICLVVANYNIQLMVYMITDNI